MSEGYIFLWRQLQDTSFYKDSCALHLAVHLLLSATHKDIKFSFNGSEQTLMRGQAIIGRHKLAESTGIKPSTIRNKLALLEKVGFLDIKSNNKFSIITILKYEDYQNVKKFQDSKKDNQRTTRGQPEDTYNNIKNVKNDKNKDIYIPQKIKFLDFVYLTDSEYSTLINKFGEPKTKDLIERLNNYIGSKGKKYKSHYHTILVWYQKEKGGQNGISQGDNQQNNGKPAKYAHLSRELNQM